MSLHLRGSQFSAEIQMARLVYDKPHRNVLICVSSMNHCLLQKQGYTHLAGPKSGADSAVE